MFGFVAKQKRLTTLQKQLLYYVHLAHSFPNTGEDVRSVILFSVEIKDRIYLKIKFIMIKFVIIKFHWEYT